MVPVMLQFFKGIISSGNLIWVHKTCANHNCVPEFITLLTSKNKYYRYNTI